MILLNETQEVARDFATEVVKVSGWFIATVSSVVCIAIALILGRINKWKDNASTAWLFIGGVGLFTTILLFFSNIYQSIGFIINNL